MRTWVHRGRGRCHTVEMPGGDVAWLKMTALIAVVSSLLAVLISYRVHTSSYASAKTFCPPAGCGPHQTFLYAGPALTLELCAGQEDMATCVHTWTVTRIHWHVFLTNVARLVALLVPVVLYATGVTCATPCDKADDTREQSVCA